ncbi:MAG: carboxypeptidase-like regulatory domain-containing protein, partial [Prevotella sp.]
MKKVLLILLAVMTAAQMYAQKTLTGTITDGDTQEPIIGASVQVTGTSSGGVSDLDGHFSIVIPEGRKTVTISYVGYKSQTINIVGKSSINIMLQPSASDLDEVVVVGYGTMKR